MLKGKSSAHPSQPGDIAVDGPLEAMAQVFEYCNRGTSPLLLGYLRRDGGFGARPLVCACLMEGATPRCELAG